MIPKTLPGWKRRAPYAAPLSGFMDTFGDISAPMRRADYLAMAQPETGDATCEHCGKRYSYIVGLTYNDLTGQWDDTCSHCGKVQS